VSLSSVRSRPRLSAFAVIAWALLAFVLAAPGLTGKAWAAPTFPALTGRVVDDAHVLSPEVQADLTQRLAALQTATSRQLIVVTLPSLQGDDISDYGYQLGRTWGVGQKGINNGALFIVVPSERKVRIEVGYGLEGTLTDAMTSVILQRAVLPRFRAGDIPGGVVAGTQAIVDQLSLDPSTAEQKAADAANQQQARGARGRHGGSPLGGIVVLFIILWVIGGVLGGRGGRGGMGWFLPGVILGGLMGGGRRDDDDWGGGGSSGGFGGGGGGSFGGGGSSGNW
jgi:uncharacterized protein